MSDSVSTGEARRVLRNVIDRLRNLPRPDVIGIALDLEAAVLPLLDSGESAKLTRLEVIDETGRAWSRWGCKIELSYQDDGRTLKAFVSGSKRPSDVVREERERVRGSDAR